MISAVVQFDELRADELSFVGVDVQADGVHVGYAYTAGLVGDPTGQQHAALIAKSREAGRFLDDNDVASAVESKDGDDANN